MGFTKPSNPLQPREGSRYLGEHSHQGIKGDLNRKKGLRVPREKAGRRHLFKWVNG
jgi:hypothetical protein